jgi:hypothetical protein
LFSDGNFLYWGDLDRNALMRLPAAGGSPLVLVTRASVVGAVVADGTNVYWAEANSGIRAVPIEGGATVDLVPASKGGNLGIAVDATAIYYSEYVYEGPRYLGRRLVKLEKTVGATPHVLYETSQTGDIYDIATDDTYVYWTNGRVESVLKTPK